MNRGYLLSILLLMLSPAAAEEPKPPTDEEIREAKVYEAIADMISRRDKLLGGKFAVVMHGESLKLGSSGPAGSPDGLHQLPQLFGRVVDGQRSFDLKFGFHVSPFNGEYGHEMLRIGTTYRARTDLDLFTTDYFEKPEKEKFADWLDAHMGYGLDPYDDYLTGANSFLDGKTYRGIERSVLKTFKLLRTESGLDDRLVSYWSYHPMKGFNYRLRMEFDPAFEMNLVRCSMDHVDHKYDFQETRIRWATHGKTLVPNRIELAYGSLNESGGTSEITFKCQWMLDDEVPDTIFTAKDHLAALMDHLKIPHTTVVNDERINAVHVLPEDLYEDKKK